ncbi:DNA primase [Planococcus lenghuensis]|uniref:DNA primase n=1 Tax=Planococcus lenghuensis TaxID=2213202 RepID=A0A1Q2KYU7_9BACL|nr:DNA primase [Planococcus lenghuensis]AQQ52977.1 DNA primase [Planococcus lenghuensis]
MSGRIPEETVEQVRTSTDIVDVIGEYVQLTKKGRNWFGLCPFHGESTPSFSVTSDKQIFHCFGCGAGGNVFTFLMDLENLSFQEAVVKVGARAGIEIETAGGQDAGRPARNQPNSRLVEMHEYAAELYQHILLNAEQGEEALTYLEKRGFTREMIEKYRIGWALPEWHHLTRMLQRKGYTLDELAESGLAIRKEGEEAAFDRFRGRVMFPLMDENGKVIAFSGRILGTSKEEAKYLNSPESPIFKKSEVLYNIHRAKSAIRKTRRIVLFEGFMDVIAAGTAGVENAVATMGTSLTASHIREMKRFARDVTICFDGDNAGWEAAKKASVLLNDEQFNVEVAVLPGELDPDDYIREHGEETFRTQIIGKPHAFLAFIMMHARRHKNFQYENDLLQYIHEVLKLLSGRSSPIERDLYIKQLAQETGLSEDAILQQYRKTETRSSRREAPPSPEVQPKRKPQQQKEGNSLSRAERLLFAHLLADGIAMERISSEEQSMPFISEEYQTLFVLLSGFHEENGQSGFHQFLETLEDPDLRKLVMEAAMAENDPEYAEAELTDCLRHLQKHRIKLEIQQKMQQSKEAEKQHDITKALLLAQEVIALRKSLT